MKKLLCITDVTVVSRTSRNRFLMWINKCHRTSYQTNIFFNKLYIASHQILPKKTFCICHVRQDGESALILGAWRPWYILTWDRQQSLGATLVRDSAKNWCLPLARRGSTKAGPGVYQVIFPHDVKKNHGRHATAQNKFPCKLTILTGHYATQMRFLQALYYMWSDSAPQNTVQMPSYTGWQKSTDPGRHDVRDLFL